MTTPALRESTCDYCKLPLPVAWSRAAPAADGVADPLYCCLGCRVAAAIAEEKGEDGVPRTMLMRLGLSIFFTMNVMAFTMAIWTGDVYGQTDQSSGLSSGLYGLFRYLVLLFSLPVFVLLGLPLFVHAWSGLRRGVVSTDWLLAMGVGASFAYSFLSVLRGRGPIYFEVGCFILVMTALGRWLEVTGKLKANAALDAIGRLLPETVRRIKHGVEEPIALGQVQLNDLLRVLPGERFPTDGTLMSARASVDEQALTGESRPVLKESGDQVLGGTLNLDGDLKIAVSATPEEGTLARVIDLVRRARESKGHYQRLADRVASKFVPVVSGVVVITLSTHWALGSLERGLWAALTVALIACPCALGLAAPLAIWSAPGQRRESRCLISQRRGARAFGRDRGDPIGQDRHADNRISQRVAVRRGLQRLERQNAGESWGDGRGVAASYVSSGRRLCPSPSYRAQQRDFGHPCGARAGAGGNSLPRGRSDLARQYPVRPATEFGGWTCGWGGACRSRSTRVAAYPDRLG